jgi:arsenate reductase
LARLSFEPGEAANELPTVLQRQRELIAERRSDLAWLDSELADLEATWYATRSSIADRPAAAPISVLFLCNANSGRSQIGEALLARVGAGRFTVQSAGNEPAAVSPLAVAVLSEVGIDWQEARSKRVEDVSGPFDYVIALSDSVSEACATIDGAHSTLHWHLPDPAGASIPAETRLAVYRRVRDEISLRLVPFVELALRTAAFSESTPLLEEVSNG